MWRRSAPDLAFYHRMSLDPRRGRLLKAVWRHFGYMCMYVTAGAVMTVYLGLPTYDRALAVAKQQAYTDALQDFEVSYKQRLIENKDTLNKACTAWWFDMTTKDRKLTVPRKQK